MSIERPNRLDEIVEVNNLYNACTGCGHPRDEHEDGNGVCLHPSSDGFNRYCDCAGFTDPGALAEWMEPLVHTDDPAGVVSEKAGVTGDRL